MIIFPFFPTLLSLFLKLFVEELIVYRFFQILIYAGMLLLIFKIFDKIGLNNRVRNYIIISIFVILLSLYCVAEYNILCLLLILMIINIELSNYKNIKKNMLIGLLSGLVITTKQSIGIVTLISSIIVVILSNKNNLEKIKIICIRFLFSMIPIILLIFYLLYNNAFDQFLNYTILGLKDFSKNKLSYWYLIIYEEHIISCMAVFILFGYVYIVYKNFKCKLKDNILMILSIYSLAGLSIMIPIMNAAHFMPANIISIIILIYLLNLKRNENEKYLNKITVTINIFSVFLIILIIITFIYNNFNSNDYKHYRYINTSNNEKRLSEVTQFIQDNPNTYIIDATSVMYMIPTEKYNGILDMLLIGNIGKNGEEKIISKISELKSGYLLIDKDSNWQNVINIIEYIEQNYELEGSVGDFNIYKIESQASLRSLTF